MANDNTQEGRSRRRWLTPVAAAASVALIGGVIWGVSSNGSNSNQQAAPAVTQPAPVVTQPTAPTSAGSSKAPVPNVAPPPPSGSARTGATSLAILTVYYLGASKTPALPVRLYQEFVNTPVPVGATGAQRAKAAVSAAMKPFLRKAAANRWTGSETYMDPWTGTSVTNVTVTPTLITITLDGAGRKSVTGPTSKIADDTALAPQQLVWTAQAAVGKGAIPVKFVTPRGARLFEKFPTTQTYNRPPPSLQFEVLAPIWIIYPVYGQIIPAVAPQAGAPLAGAPLAGALVAFGQSCAFEGTTQWQLKKSGKTVRSGFTTATSGCPTRGTWQVKLGGLAPGSYTFRMYEVSQEDGKRIIADTSKPFTVR